MRTALRMDPRADVIFDCGEQSPDTDQLLRNRLHLGIAALVLVTSAVTAVAVGNDDRLRDGDRAARATEPARIDTVSLRTGVHLDTDGDRGTYLLTIRNSGAAEVTVSTPSADAFPPGLTADPNAPAGASMVVLPPGGSGSLALAYRITDCAAVPLKQWPLRLPASVAGSAEDAYVELTPPGLRGRTWQESAIADYCETGG